MIHCKTFEGMLEMSTLLNIGFIGGGANSAVGKTHFIASQMDGRFRVRAGCFSLLGDVNMQTAKEWGIPPDRVYETGADLLQKEKDHLDAIVVLTPTPNHTGPVIEALQSGYPVICEKALASSSADILSIRQAQMKQNGFLTVTYNYTGYPMIRELRQIIREGKLGKLTQIHIEMPQEGFARFNRDGSFPVPQEWRLHDTALPTISLDLGTHLHNMIDFLTGETPEEVMAIQSSKGHFSEVIDNVMCMAHYTHSLECSIWYSKAALGYRNGLRVRVFGTGGSAEWYQMDPEFLLCFDAMGRKSLIDRASTDVTIANADRYNRFKPGHPDGFFEAFANLYSDIADGLANYLSGSGYVTDYLFGAQHALEGLLLLEAMAESARTRSWQTVKFI